MWLPIPPVGWQRCLGSSIIAYLKISLLRISIWHFSGNRNIWVGDIGIIIGAGREKRTDTEFSFANYNEAENRLNEYSRIGKEAENLLASLDKDSQPAFISFYTTR